MSGNKIQPASADTITSMLKPARIRIRMKGAAAGTGQVFHGQEKVGTCASCGQPSTLSRPAGPGVVPPSESPVTS